MLMSNSSEFYLWLYVGCNRHENFQKLPTDLPSRIFLQAVSVHPLGRNGSPGQNGSLIDYCHFHQTRQMS